MLRDDRGMSMLNAMLLACLLALPLAGRTQVVVLPALPDAGGTPERVLTVYSSLDVHLADPLLRLFQADHPGIAIRYEDLLTGTIHDRIVAESEGPGVTADFVFSSAMDLQVKLVNDGYARRIEGPDTAGWPDWAMWREAAYALTFEPAVFAYHRPSFAGRPPPATRADLQAWMEADPAAAHGRVATYDIARSGVGYLFMARDQDLFPGVWRVVEAMGRAGVRQFPTSGEILGRIKTGEIAVGYNLLGSYVSDWARLNPDEIGMVLPADFTVVISRVALVPRAAAAPDLGETLLAWLMSAPGQRALSSTLRLPAVSLEVAGTEGQAGNLRDLSGLRLKPVPVGPGLLAYLDQATRAGLIARWNRAVQPLPQ